MPPSADRSSSVRRAAAALSTPNTRSTVRRRNASPASVRQTRLFFRLPSAASKRRTPSSTSFFRAEFTVCLGRDSCSLNWVWVRGASSDRRVYSSQKAQSGRPQAGPDGGTAGYSHCRFGHWISRKHPELPVPSNPSRLILSDFGLFDYTETAPFCQGLPCAARFVKISLVFFPKICIS